MQVASALAGIMKEDAAEAVRLYFEPLFRFISWLRHRLSGSVQKEDREHLSRAVQTLGVGVRDVEVLELNSQGNYRLQVLREAPLILLERGEPMRRMQYFGLVAGDSSLLGPEARFRAVSRILEVLTADTARLDAQSHLLSIDFGQGNLSLLASLLSLDDLQPAIENVKIVGLSSSGRSTLLDLVKAGEPSDQGQLLLEGFKRPQVPEIGRQVLGRFGVYLEVASFLAQEGYEEAAVAVVDRAFKLFRPGEMNKPTREAK